MNIQHVNVKLFVAEDSQVDFDRLIEVFHGWVANQETDSLLIDVADYRHVPHGPAVILVGHHADYVLDHARGKLGLVYNRKASLEGSNADRFRQALRAAVEACDRLEGEIEGLQFNRQAFDLAVNDRALAPNTPETLAALKPEIESFLSDIGQQGFDIQYDDSDVRRTFQVAVTLQQPIEASSVPA